MIDTEKSTQELLDNAFACAARWRPLRLEENQAWKDAYRRLLELPIEQLLASTLLHLTVMQNSDLPPLPDHTSPDMLKTLAQRSDVAPILKEYRDVAARANREFKEFTAAEEALAKRFHAEGVKIYSEKEFAVKFTGSGAIILTRDDPNITQTLEKLTTERFRGRQASPIQL